jgi:hypothetical protein
VLEPDGQGPGALADHRDDGHLDDVGRWPRGEHAQHPGPVPAAEERHQPVEVDGAALGQPRHQLPDRAGAGQPLDEQDRELAGERGALVKRERLGVTGFARLRAHRLLLGKRRPELW